MDFTNLTIIIQRSIVANIMFMSPSKCRTRPYMPFCFLFCCCLISGCGGSTPYLLKAVVILDSKPLTEAEVILLPVRENAKSASGITNAEGEVTFKTEGEDGVFAGSYIITVSKIVEERRLTNDEIRALAEVGARYRPQMVELVPEKYTRRDTSDLKVKVGYWQPVELTLELYTEGQVP